MTGKKYLFEKSTSCLDIDKDLWDILNFEIMKLLQEENEKLKNKLTKYKRAFEIFAKDKEVTLHKGKCPILGIDEYKLSFVNWKSLTKEQYELLEELMKDE